MIWATVSSQSSFCWLYRASPSLAAKNIINLISVWKCCSQYASKFGLGIQNEAGQRLIEFCQENALVTANTLFQQHKEDSTHGHHQMVNSEIRLITFFVAKDGEALYSQQKLDWELTVAQIMNSILPNSDLNWRKQRKPLDHSSMT